MYILFKHHFDIWQKFIALENFKNLPTVKDYEDYRNRSGEVVLLDFKDFKTTLENAIQPQNKILSKMLKIDEIANLLYFSYERSKDNLIPAYLYGKPISYIFSHILNTPGLTLKNKIVKLLVDGTLYTDENVQEAEKAVIKYIDSNYKIYYISSRDKLSEEYEQERKKCPVPSFNNDLFFESYCKSPSDLLQCYLFYSLKCALNIESIIHKITLIQLYQIISK